MNNSNMNFTLNVESAREASKPMNTRIDEAGQYHCTIVKAKLVTSQKGTFGVELGVTSDEGGRADYLTLWLKDKDGEELFGAKAIQAMMVCMKLKNLSVGTIHYEDFNKETQKREKVSSDGFVELMGKPVGMLLRKEIYSKIAGGDGEQMIILSFFESKTDFTASEILDRATEPTQKAAAMIWLEKNPMKDSRTTKHYDSKPTTTTTTKQSFDGFDDDIPF